MDALPTSTGRGLKSQEMFLNMGPHHPSTHGVLRFVLRTDGEIVADCEPDVGFLHRSIEKIGEKVSYHQFLPYTDRVDYVAAMCANWAYCATVEKLADIEVPERAEYLRVIACELNRLSSHLVAVGTYAMDIGASTPFTLAIRDREIVNDIFEEICGARLTYHYWRLGGVSFDLPEHTEKKIANFLDYFDGALKEFNNLISGNKIFIERLVGVAPIGPEEAMEFGLVGPNLRASGVDFDIRRDEPYSIYPELEFDVPLGTGEKGVVGDCYDRYVVRIREMEESARIVRQCLEKMPREGEIQSKVKKRLKIETNEIYHRVESARGEMGYYIKSNGSDVADRMRIRTGSFTAIAAMREVSRGLMIADLVALIASLDIIAPEIDR